MTATAPKNLDSGLTAWVLTNSLAGLGTSGFETQALGIVEAMGIIPEIKRVSPPLPWRWFSPWGPAAPDANIAPPWPDLLIASGRQAIPYARQIRARGNGKTFVAVLQNPRVSPAAFDFVWAPEHDGLKGANVFSTLLSPHQLSPERLAREAKRIEAKIAQLPRPRIAVLLGGSNAVYRLDENAAARIGRRLSDVTDQTHGGLMITPSRRTGARQAQIIRDLIKDKPAAMWDGNGDNPYFGYLGSADAVIVTCDSVNMISEAAATGKPVHIIELEGGSARFRRFLDQVYAQGIARPFAGRLESRPCKPLNATREIADAIARAMRDRRPRV